MAIFSRSAGIRKELVMQQTAHKSIGTSDNTPNSHEWKLHDLTRKVLWWADIFNNAFFKEQSVPAPAISYKKTNLITLGQNVVGSNEFGLKEIFSRVHLSHSLWETLVIIIHEMTHAWQALFGKPSNSWYHNQEFRRKLLESYATRLGVIMGLGILLFPF